MAPEVKKLRKSYKKVLTLIEVAGIIYYVVNRQRKWRNWQTRRTKDPVTALGREGSSPSFRIG